MSGQFTNTFPWPDIGIHTHLLPNGQILTWADAGHNGALTLTQGITQTFLIGIPIGGLPTSVQEVDTNHTLMFCSGTSFLPDGRLAVLGGESIQLSYGSGDSNYFNPWATTWNEGPEMAHGRWYATSTTLANGEVVADGGYDETHVVNPVPEVSVNGFQQWVELSGATRAIGLYPRSFLAPNGQIFIASPIPISFWLDPTGAGKITIGPKTNYGGRQQGTAVMYDNGKILIIGGNDPATNTVEAVDLTAAKPAWTYVNPMNYPRRHLNATILADGKILVTGGTQSGKTATAAVLPIEEWDPSTGQWTVMASLPHPRLYHSSAILLQDGRVLTAGGTKGTGSAETGSNYLDAEIYSPPYLFNGPQPTIASAPSSVGYGQSFQVTTPDVASITNLNWIRLSANTHSFNMNQRIVRPAFTQDVTNGLLNVTAPSDANQCPPGHYLMFILNGSGVPSVASIIQIM